MFSILEKVIKVRDFSHFLLESPFFNVVLEKKKSTNMEEESFQSQFFHQFGDIWASLVVSYLGSRGGSDGKASACNAGDLGSIPGSGRSPGEGNGNPLQHSCLENPMDGGA